MFRTLLTSICLFWMIQPAWTQDGMQFYHGSLQEAVAYADSLGKPVFIETYADWCGPCKMMEREVFPDSSVGAFFNENFVNVKVDVDTREGNRFARQYGVQFIPRLMFMHPDGTVIHQKEGFFSPRLFLRMGKRALKKAGS